MFRFTITELKYRTLCVRKTWRSFLSLVALMSHLCQSVKGKMIFWRLDPVWSPGYLNRRVESNDGTVLPRFDPVWSPQIRSAKIIQPKAEPKLELPRLIKWNTVLPTFNPVCSPEIRSAIIMHPNAMPKLKLPRLTKWSPIILALPLIFIFVLFNKYYCVLSKNFVTHSAATQIHLYYMSNSYDNFRQNIKKQPISKYTCLIYYLLYAFPIS